ncbi:hypothetical protein WJX72_000688 [[Myrmecia] bisecta]|uniref:Dienelactone hydrolase domain-containing protein n=1 Tax=[Myrmecia] bisecta TaxID=41462 RepID=A0AAW1PZL5_9CHLO
MGSTGEEFKACCSGGHIWQGTPSGSEGTVGGVSAYIAEPATASDKAVLLLTDIYGWQAKNPRLIADRLAQNGFLVVIPDLFAGKHWTEGKPWSELRDWAAQFPKEAQLELVKRALADTRSQSQVEHVGLIGHCWGGLFTVLLTGEGIVDAGVIAHGSMITLDMVKAIKMPTMFLCAENDQQIPASFRAEIQQVLPELKTPTAFKLYPGTEHGFAVRGDITVPAVAAAADDAFAETLKFLTEHWQLYSAGKREEKACRFCHSTLPDWRQAHQALPRAPPIMTVTHNGAMHLLTVQPGEAGMAEFQANIRGIFGLQGTDVISLTFGCKAPGSGEDLTLEGWASFDAAVHCAAIAAGQRAMLETHGRRPDIQLGPSLLPAAAQSSADSTASTQELRSHSLDDAGILASMAESECASSSDSRPAPPTRRASKRTAHGMFSRFRPGPRLM